MDRAGLGVIDVTTIETPSLGDRSYVVGHGAAAVVVDPQRDIDRVLAAVAGRTVTHVVETHVHNDYVSGGLELSRALGAEYCLSGHEKLAFDHTPLADGEGFMAGSMEWRAEPTPGHTPHHVSYVVAAGGEPVAAFTGGSLLYGTVGRTDLIGAELTRQLAGAQYRSARRLLAELPGDAVVYPTHGFGSFCSSIAPPEDGAATPGPAFNTVATERQDNAVTTFDDEAAFVDHLVAGLGAYPHYYAHMGPANRAGPHPIDLSPPPDVAADQLAARISAGEWVVDLRTRHAYAASHLAGTIAIEMSDSFSTYLGWLIPWGKPVTLLGGEDQVAEAQRQLARIGIDRPAGRAVGAVPDGRSYRVARWPDLAAEIGRPEVQVVDVRREEEWRESHVAGAIHAPLHELDERLGELPDAELWVHCLSGYRASIAASLLDRAGLTPVLIDDEFPKAATAGVPVSSP